MTEKERQEIAEDFLLEFQAHVLKYEPDEDYSFHEFVLEGLDIPNKTVRDFRKEMEESYYV